MSKTVLFQTIQFKKVCCLNVKTVQAIQFSIRTPFSSIWSTEKTLSGATTLGESGPGSDGNEEVLYFLQSFTALQEPHHLIV